MLKPTLKTQFTESLYPFKKVKNRQDLVKPLNSSQLVSCSHQTGCSLWNAGDPEELSGGSSWRRGLGTGVWTDALSPGPRPEDTPHAAHAVPLLRQVSDCLTYTGAEKQTEILESVQPWHIHQWINVSSQYWSFVDVLVNCLFVKLLYISFGKTRYAEIN